VLKAYADQWALVTGGSSGIGAEFARQLAARGMHLVLTARREEQLQQLAAELHQTHGTKTVLIVADLAVPTEPARILKEIGERGLTLELLVNNAGFGVVAEIEQTDVNRLLEMLKVNVSALAELTLRVLPGMLQRGHGGIINVSSVAAFQPVGYMGAYAATKAFVLHFSESLWAEARERGDRHGPLPRNDAHRVLPGLGSAQLAGAAFIAGSEDCRAHSPQGARQTPQLYRVGLEELHSHAPGADRHAGHGGQGIDEILQAAEAVSGTIPQCPQDASSPEAPTHRRLK